MSYNVDNIVPMIIKIRGTIVSGGSSGGVVPPVPPEIYGQFVWDNQFTWSTDEEIVIAGQFTFSEQLYWSQ